MPPPLPLAPPVPVKRIADLNIAAIHGAKKKRKENVPQGSNRRNYIKELEAAYNEPDSSEEAALATLKQDAEFPPIEQVKFLVKNVAVHAVLRLEKNSRGMSMNTAKEFLRRQLGCKSATKEQKGQLADYVTCLAKVEKIIPTGNRPKRFVRELDMYDFTGACFDPKVTFQIGYDRVQVAALGQMLYVLGQRPGCIVENVKYTGFCQVLKWEDMDWIVLGFEPGLGLQFQVFIKFHHMKNMRDDNGKFMQTSLRSVGRHHILLDPIITLLAMAIEHNIFVEDVYAFSEDPSKLPQLPYQLTICPNKQSLPVFTQVTIGDPDFKAAHAYNNRVGPLKELPKNKRKRTEETFLGPWTYFAAAKAIQKVGNHLGWCWFMMLSFRYAWAGNALGKMNGAHLRHHMGHQPKTLMVSTTYQVPDRPVDVTAIRFGTEADLSVSDFHSSVAWEGYVTERSTFDASVEIFKKNPTTRPYYDALMVAKAKVKANFKSYLDVVEDEHCNDDLVVEAHDARFSVQNAHAKLLEQVEAISNTSIKLDLNQPQTADELIIVDSSQACMNKAPVDLQTLLPIQEEELAYQISCTNTHHPYQQLIDSNCCNPCHTLLMRYMYSIAFGKIRDQGMCGYCFTNESLNKKKRKKVYPRYSEHAWACGLTHNPNTWRCPICAKFVPHSPGTKEILEEHLLSCFKVLEAVSEAYLSVEDGSIEEVDEDEDEDNADVLDTSEGIKGQAMSCRVGADKNALIDPETLVGQGAFRLSIATKVDCSRKNSRLFFCPICFFAPCQLAKKISQRSGEDSRFKFFWDTSRLGQHMASHWKTLSKSSVSGINYNLDLKCGFSECQHLLKMNTGEMISHLHNEHSYKLVECALEHPHTKLCFVLPAGFATKATGELISKHLHADLHTTTLRDFNRNDKVANTQKAHEKRIFELASKGVKIETPTTFDLTNAEASLTDLVNDIMDWCAEAELDIEFEVKEEELLDDFMHCTL
ncbi:hypothetical protein CPB83DRAFT_895738 [Crepidotus variabilis]|uniref:Uncharacterized protein n=1 Tax=Crepidotus variabilis TaxID=179855 RepID=A0A9P6EDF9_9AGAR|nr:hypothetical protein CPB83DRAFT_895738 [Crepidotus variabilis]